MGDPFTEYRVQKYLNPLIIHFLDIQYCLLQVIDLKTTICL